MKKTIGYIILSAILLIIVAAFVLIVVTDTITFLISVAVFLVFIGLLVLANYLISGE